MCFIIVFHFYFLNELICFLPKLSIFVQLHFISLFSLHLSVTHSSHTNTDTHSRSTPLDVWGGEDHLTHDQFESVREGL